MPAEAVSLVADARKTPSLLGLVGACRPMLGGPKPGGSCEPRHDRHRPARPIPPSRPAASSAEPARRDAAVRLGAGTGLWLSLLLVAYWWAAGGGFQDLGGWQRGLTSLGRLTGLVASDLLLVQVLLIARLPQLERAFGQDQLARHHGWSASARST